MRAPSRNAPCPCGSGLKYKRCCLAAEQRARETASFEDAVGKRISAWTLREFPEETRAALDELGGSDPELKNRDLQIFATWLCSDRRLAGGTTPAERYAARGDIDERERDVAARIAAARLSLRRVRAVEPGRSIELEDILTGEVVGVRSAEVSCEAARWDVLLCRLMDDDWVPSLWGPVLVYAPGEEAELLAELERLAEAHMVAADPNRLAEVFRVAALELMRFVPDSRRIDPSFFTAEGDEIVNGSASWSVTGAPAALELLDSPPELAWVGENADGSGEAFQLTADRAKLLAHRPQLPPGALCFESSLTELPGRLCLATFELTDEELRCTAVSEPRLDAAIAVVAERLGALAELRERTVMPFEYDLSAPRRRAPRRREPPPGLTTAEARELEQEMINDHYRRWLDEPLPSLGGVSPRQAAAGRARGELETIVRGIENRAERARRDGVSWPEVGWLRDELGLHTDRLTA